MPEKLLITPRSFGKDDPGLFERLERAGYSLVRNDTGGILSKKQMIERIAPCVGVILGVDPMDAEVFAAAPSLRAVSRYGVGMDNVDEKAAKARGVQVSKTVGANSDAVADYAFALMLALARRLVPIDAGCRAGDWGKQTTLDVCGRTLGIFGLGAIGRALARRAHGFSMRVMAYDPFWDEDYARENAIERAQREQILREADFISLHLPLLPETRGFIGRDEIALMKRDAVLINTARGGLVNESALLEALRERRIYGAGMDAFSTEPPENREWFALDNVVLGSHCAASTRGAVANMGRMAVDNLLCDLSH